MENKKACEHVLKADINIKQSGEACEECVKEGTHWVELRVCLACGHVGCCDSSIGRHATKHFRNTAHPVMADLPGRDWKWCYVDKDYV